MTIKCLFFPANIRCLEATSAFLSLMFASYVSSHPFTFSQYISLYLKCVSYKQYIVGFSFSFFSFLVHFYSLCLLIHLHLIQSVIKYFIYHIQFLFLCCSFPAFFWVKQVFFSISFYLLLLTFCGFFFFLAIALDNNMSPNLSQATFK